MAFGLRPSGSKASGEHRQFELGLDVKGALMSATSARINLMLISVLLLALFGVAAADRPGVRAPLQAANDRKPAPDFELQDSSGKITRLKDYHGKVLLLDFWARDAVDAKRNPL